MQQVRQAIEWYARHEPARPAVADERQTFSYRELHESVNRLASLLACKGLKEQFRVLLLMTNSAAYVQTVLAVEQLGCSILSVNHRLTTGEIASLTVQAGVDWVITERRFEELAGALADCGGSGIKLLYKEELAEAAMDGEFPPPPVPGKPCADIVFFTSGSTGKPKGIVLDKSVLHMRRQTNHSPEAAVYLSRPLYFRAHFSSMCYLLQEGKTIVLCSQSSPAMTLTLLERHRVEQIVSSPPDLMELARFLETESARLPDCLQEIVSTGATLTAAVKERLLAHRNRARLVDLYGLSEIGAVSLINDSEWAGRAGSVGRPIFFVRIRIEDEQLNELPPGQVGEICLSSRFMMKEYFQDSAQTAASLRNGYFRTGDLGYVDADGYLYLSGRKNHTINRDGNHFRLSEVEAALAAHPGVLQTAVLAQTDETGQQTPVAFIECDKSYCEPLNEDVLLQHCRSRLAAFKVPARILLLDALPVMEAGKIDLDRLQTRIESNIGLTGRV